MAKYNLFRKGTIFFKAVNLLVVVAIITGGLSLGFWRSSSSGAALYNLPSPTRIISLSKDYSLPLLKGIRFDPQNPLNLEFIIDTGSKKAASKEEAGLLIRYFLAGLTLSEEELWVNLSPYEEERVASDDLALTDLGKDMLGQDYVLKQLFSSLTYPESKTGRNYWKEVYEGVAQIAGTTNIPINTFNKVWIMPDKITVYENGNIAFISHANLKTMLEEDYFALKNSPQSSANNSQDKNNQEIHKVASRVMKELIIPKINNDVNYGQNFSTLRQIYHSLILGIWFKQKFKDTLYKHYIDQGKISGIDLEDRGAKEKIYQLYVEAYKKGVYNYIKNEREPVTKKAISRQYYSGGLDFGKAIREGMQTISTASVGVSEGEIDYASEGNLQVVRASGTTVSGKKPQTVSSPAEKTTDSSSSPIMGLMRAAISKVKKLFRRKPIKKNYEVLIYPLTGIPFEDLRDETKKILFKVGVDNRLVEMTKAAGNYTGVLFGFGLPNLRESFGVKFIKKHWSGLVELVKSEGRSAGALFESGLPNLRESFGV
ncbi:MAG: hypothetical protein JSW17_04305, partial [Candidatus Omnitrophota bacterium]